MYVSRTKFLPVTIITLYLNIPSTSSSGFSCPGVGFYPDPASCEAFYRCLDQNTAYRYICPPGTRFDLTLRNCNHAHLAPPCPLDDPKPPKLTTQPPTTTTKPPTTTSTTTKVPNQLSEQSGVDCGPFLGCDSHGDSGDSDDLYGEGEDGDDSTVLEFGPGSGPGEEYDYEDYEDEDNTFVEFPGNSNGTIAGNPDENQDRIPLFPPPLSTPVTSVEVTESTPVPPLVVTDPPTPDQLYSVAPNSLYPCTQPGYYSEETSCKQFFVCREVAPGVLSAEKIFRCPNRYLFDPETRLCQREHKVTCRGRMEDMNFLFYSSLNSFIVPLKESDLSQFFSLPLTLPRVKRPYSLVRPVVYTYGRLDNPFPWVLYRAAIH